MLALYPSNRLEHLSFLLNALLNKSEQPILRSKTILVESTGMQHWLNLQIAQHNGIAMNLDFPMPTRYVWQLCRDILGDDKVPYQSVYKREVMQWRIEKILKSSEFASTQFEVALERYWESQSLSADTQARRVDLSRHIADTFEQYLMFRPHWLLAWEAGNTAETMTLAEAEKANFQKHEQWQAWLWRALVKEEPNHPVRLQKNAIACLHERHHVLPKEVYFFGINTMAPQTLDFFSEIAKYTNIHFFHLNPCVDYWGDATSDKAIAASLRQGKIDAWVNKGDVHPLLRNLGQQGKDLFNLLSSAQNYEIAAFDTQSDFVTSEQTKMGSKRLHRLSATQLGILEGQDSLSQSPSISILPLDEDDSIVMRSCHSPLREVQVLHDYLLQKLNEDATLQPQDILVMCPAIEDYSPFINAIFAKGVSSLSQGQASRVPCSIADRNPLDAEPLIASYVQMLSLPDSRFSVVDLMAFCRTPAVMSKFSLTEEDLALFALWIEKSNIFWGLDSEHRNQFVQKENDDSHLAKPYYTWEWGLNRLLDGLICSDSCAFSADGASLLNEVEGQLSLTLGRLIQVIEKLDKHRRLMTQFRTMSQWKAYLLELKDDVFAVATKQGFGQVSNSQSQFADHMLTQTIGSFFEHFSMANVNADTSTDQTWSIKTIRTSLEQAFSSPDSRNHFMTGQVTFCSMMPMRSIPFKVIAILGLNDEDFPRKNNQVDLNLMNHSGRQLGDRSRRGDDRYLFLEAILSARKALYLSYQGKSIKNNKDKEPSLVFTEFLEQMKAMCEANDCESPSISQQPLRPFSLDNFSLVNAAEHAGIQQSHDEGWFRLMRQINHIDATEQANTSVQVSGLSTAELPSFIALSDLVSFYKDPLKTFANHSQGLFLDKVVQEFNDVEPFGASGLDKYNVINSATASLLEKVGDAPQSDASYDENEVFLSSMQAVFRQQLGSGDIPDDAVNKSVLSEWLLHSKALADALILHYPFEQKNESLLIPIWGGLSTTLDDIASNDGPGNNIKVEYYRTQGADGSTILFTSSRNSLKNLFEGWLLHLFECAQSTDCSNEEITSSIVCYSLGKNHKKQAQLQVSRFQKVEVEQAKFYLNTVINCYYAGLQQPSLLIADLAESMLKNVQGDKDFDAAKSSLSDFLEHPNIIERWEKIFTNTFNVPFFMQSPYFQHYIKEVPHFNEKNLAPMLACFQPMFAALNTSSETIEINNESLEKFLLDINVQEAE